MKKIYTTPETDTVTLSERFHLLAGSEPTPDLPVDDDDADPGDGGSSLAKPRNAWASGPLWE